MTRILILGCAFLLTGLPLAAVSYAQAIEPSTTARSQELNSRAVENDSGSVLRELVVTGSRLKSDRLESASPVVTVTQNQAALTGYVDVAQVLETLPAFNITDQVNNEYSGIITVGGPGANTLSLRGVGADRTLLLVDGRRLGPAGVGGTVGPVDLNTIPLSMIDRVEILKDGAASIYGSDAIAGVVNIIAKTDSEGGDLHAFSGASQHGGGDIYQLSGHWGKRWRRGYLSLGLDIYRQEALNYGQRSYLACAADHAIDAETGAPADVIDPQTGSAKCDNLLANLVVDQSSSTLYAPNSSAVAGGGLTAQNVAGFQAVGLTLYNPDGTIDRGATRLSQGQIPESSPRDLTRTALSPVRRYAVSMFGGYDLSEQSHLYTEIMANERDSRQRIVDQFFTAINPANPFNAGFGQPLAIVTQNTPQSQRVDYGRIVLGVKGDLSLGPLRDWHFDLYSEASRSDASYRQRFALADRVNATAGAGAGTGGCDVNSLSPGGAGESMAELEPGVACVPVDYFQAVRAGGFTPAEAAFLYTEQVGHTKYDHYAMEGTATGDLPHLLAAPIGAVAGFQVRRETLDDRPPPAFVNENVYNATTAGRTAGSEDVQEIFGELRLPFVRDLMGAKAVDATLSGRLSHYSSYGTTGTYKLGLSWEVSNWITVRGTYGTGFRAPALYELFLAHQTGFATQFSIDPCIDYATSGASLNVQKNCAAQGLAGDFPGTNTSAAVQTGGGAGHLKAETSTSNSVGIVLTPNLGNRAKLRISTDYFTYDIRNQIQQFGAADIIYECYNSPTFPSSPFCSLFNRDRTPGTMNFEGIDTVTNDYVNVARQLEQGLDADVEASFVAPRDIKIALDGSFSWLFYANTVLLDGNTNNFLGQVGQPRFVGNISVRLDKGPWTVASAISLVGHASDDRYVSAVDPDYLTTGQKVSLDHTAPFYELASVSIQRRFSKLALEFGVKNLFDVAPPVYSAEGFQQRLGTAPLATQYDLIGRTFFLSIDQQF